MTKVRLKNLHTVTYVIVFISLLFGFAVLSRLDWNSGSQLHSLLDIVAALIGVVAGTLALNRFYVDRDNLFLLIGCGFLSVGIVDVSHTFSIPLAEAEILSTEAETVSAETWAISRVLLAGAFCWSLLSSIRGVREGSTARLRERYVFAGFIFILASVAMVIAFAPVPAIKPLASPFYKSMELVSAGLFGIALLVCLRTKIRVKGDFEYWIVLSLLVSTVSQTIFSPISSRQFDPLFDAAHVAKVASYALVLIGLLIEFSRLFKQIDENEDVLRKFVENAPAGVAMLDRNLRYLRVSRQWLRETHLLGENVIGRQIFDLFPNMPEEWLKALRSGLAGIEKSHNDDLFQRPDGSRDWIRWEIHPWHLRSGEVGGIIMILEVVTERKEFEKQLGRYQDIVNASSYMMAFIDPKYRYLTVNDAFVEWCELERDEILGRTPALIFGDQTFDRFLKKRLDRILAGEEEIRVEGWFDIPRYGRRFLIIIYRPLRNDVGKVSGIIIIARDETSHTMAEEELSQYKQIVSASRDLLALVGTDYRFKTSNKAYAAAYGKTVKELIGQGVWQMVGREMFETVIKNNFDRAASGEDVRYQSWLNLPSMGRKFFDVYYHPFRETDGRISGVVLSARDVTERALTEDALERSEARMRAIVDTVADGIITINQKGLVQSLNPATERIFGFESSEIIGRNVNVLAGEPYRSAHDQYLHNYLGTGNSKIIGRTREMTGRRKSGEVFPLELSVTELRLGAESLFVGVVRDISDRKKVDRAKDQFLSTVSHELRTPLTSIRGSLGLLNAGVVKNLDEKGKSLISLAEKNTLRLIEMVNDLLDIEKIEAGKMEFRFESIDLSRLVEQAIADNIGFADEYDVVFELSNSVTDAVVLADEGRLTQVMSNLLSNAAKFSPPGARVDVFVEPTVSGFRVSVTDQGPGVPQAHRKNIFEPFTQVDSSDRRAVGGTGLGLNISKTIVERHGGTIGFEPGETVGSKFYFDIPEWITETEPRQPSITSILNNTGLTTPRILVVEDDPDVADVIAFTLQQSGYQVDIAGNAETAKAKLEAQSYDAITIDIVLPDQNGLLMLKEIYENPRTRDLRAVIVSAIVSEVDDHFPISPTGAVDEIGKPFDKKRLLTAIKAAVAGRNNARTVLYVEDDLELVEMVTELLFDVTAVVSAGTVEEATEILDNQRVDLVVLDIGLPDGSGLELLPKLKYDNGTSIPVIVFSGTEVSAAEVLGVDAAFVKSRTSNDTFVEAVRGFVENKSKTGV